ncbi:protein of unknown function [Candidatus Promineifilum breve]|uniref:Uncharacterized protein n=1 Tax=Candidatus Promineifilum breve TaxID=1806508 RepID=A0A170PJX7_9CHLR|nr:protein of unknown function [Candidatus Promineifilum breve]
MIRNGLFCFFSMWTSVRLCVRMIADLSPFVKGFCSKPSFFLKTRFLGRNTKVKETEYSRKYSVSRPQD